MGALFEELARRETPAGLLTLRRRVEPSRQVDVFEVKLGDEFLMSSLFTVGEEELARLGLAAVVDDDGDRDRDGLDAVVGGLGLGYTAATALDDDRVASLVVVEAVDAVIDWHQRGLLPDTGLARDDRTRFVHGDFFALARDSGWDPDVPGRQFDAVLLDVDHTPRHHLHPSHAPFYTAEGLVAMRRFLRPGGVFALWSDDPPDEDFLAVLGEVFDDVQGHVVSFRNFLTGGESANTVYVAR